MSASTLVVIGIIIWSVWLLWHGRDNSPRRRREQARWDALMAEAIREKRNRP